MKSGEAVFLDTEEVVCDPLGNEEAIHDQDMEPEKKQHAGTQPIVGLDFERGSKRH